MPTDTSRCQSWPAVWVSLQSSTETLSYVSSPEGDLFSRQQGRGKSSLAGQILSSNDTGEGAGGRNTFFRKEMQMLSTENNLLQAKLQIDIWQWDRMSTIVTQVIFNLWWETLQRKTAPCKSHWCFILRHKLACWPVHCLRFTGNPREHTNVRKPPWVLQFLRVNTLPSLSEWKKMWDES